MLDLGLWLNSLSVELVCLIMGMKLIWRFKLSTDDWQRYSLCGCSSGGEGGYVKSLLRVG